MAISLRRLTEADLLPTFVARNNPSVYKWCRQNAPMHWAKHQEWFKWQANDPHTSMFALERHGVVMGVCGLTSIDYVNSRAEFSHYTIPSHQGKGYAKEALDQLFYYGFCHLGLNRIWGEVFEGNPALTLFTDYLGMKIDGVREEFYYRDGRYIDATLVSIGSANFLDRYFKREAGHPNDDENP